MNWFSDFKYNLKQSRNTKWLNSELEKRYYKPKSNSIIKILSEIEKKAGLSPYDIVPFLIKINLMSEKGSMIEKGGNGKIVTDRKRNTELFSELEQLGFIRIIEDKLYSFYEGERYPTLTKECVLRVKLLPKGIDYLIENRKREKDDFYKKFTIYLLVVASVLSLPQAIYYRIEIYSKEENKCKTDNVDNTKSPQENSNKSTEIQGNHSTVTKVKAIKKKPMLETRKPIS